MTKSIYLESRIPGETRAALTRLGYPLVVKKGLISISAAPREWQLIKKPDYYQGPPTRGGKGLFQVIERYP